MDALNIETPGDLARLYQHRTKKQFGQHFLVDPSILDGLIEEAGVGAGDRVLEIGPGCGTLTWRLLEHDADVVAVEIDRDAAEFLRTTLGSSEDADRLKVVEGDVLEQDIRELLAESEDGAGEAAEKWRSVSNLPYNVGTEVFFRLAEVFDRFERLVLMFQREVANRFVARAGDDDFGRLSLMARLYADAETVMTLPPGAFSPPPKVRSAAVRFDPVEGTRIPDAAVRGRFKRLVSAAFQARRKTLPNALLSTGLEKDRLREAIEDAGLDPRIRPGKVAFEQFEAIAERLPALDEDGE